MVAILAALATIHSQALLVIVACLIALNALSLAHTALISTRERTHENLAQPATVASAAAKASPTGRRTRASDQSTHKMT